MGVALVAALDGREQLATPPESPNWGVWSGRRTVAKRAGQRGLCRHASRQGQKSSPHGSVDGDKGRRPRRDEDHALHPDQDGACRRLHDVERLSAFRSRSQVFAEDGAAAEASPRPAQIYGVQGRKRVSLKTVDFPLDTAAFDEKSGPVGRRGGEGGARNRRDSSPTAQSRSPPLHYIVPEQLATRSQQALNASYGVRIVPENVSLAPRTVVDEKAWSSPKTSFLSTPTARSQSLRGRGLCRRRRHRHGRRRSPSCLNAPALKAGTVLRVGLEVRGEQSPRSSAPASTTGRRIWFQSRSTTAGGSCRRPSRNPIRIY